MIQLSRIDKNNNVTGHETDPSSSWYEHYIFYQQKAVCRECQTSVQYRGPKDSSSLRRHLESKRCRYLKPASSNSEFDEYLNFNIDKENGLAKCLKCETFIRLKSPGNIAVLRRHLHSKAHSTQKA